MLPPITESQAAFLLGKVQRRQGSSVSGGMAGAPWFVWARQLRHTLLCVDTGVLERAINGGREGEGGSKEQHMNDVAIKKLTRRQIALVDIMVSEGLKPAQAAEKAGYAAGKSGYVSAYKSLKRANVQQYLAQRMNEEFGLSAVAAVNTVRRLATGAKSEYVALQASQDLLDRAGYKPIDRAQVQVAGDIKVSIDLG